MLTVQEVTDVEAFEKLRTDWNDLVSRTDDPAIFLTHEWFSCCIEGFGKDKQLRIVLVRDGGRLIGIAPFWCYRSKNRGLALKTMGFIAGLDTPFADVIVLPPYRERALQAIFERLSSHGGQPWDILEANQWPSECANVKSLPGVLLSMNLKSYSATSSVTPYVEIQGDWSSFLSSRSQRFRKTYRNNVNRMHKLQDVEVQCIRRDEQGRYLDQVFAVARKGWKQQIGISMADERESQRFFTRLTEFASCRGWLLMWILRVQGIPVATEYDLVCRDRVYALRADFDEEYRDHSPGAYLEYQIVQWLFKEGLRAYFTGPGMNTYKLHWTEQFKENKCIVVCNRTFSGRMQWLAEGKIIPCLRHMRDGIVARFQEGCSGK